MAGNSWFYLALQHTQQSLFSDQSVNESVIHSKVTVTVNLTATLAVAHLFVHYPPNRVIDLVAIKV